MRRRGIIHTSHRQLKPSRGVTFGKFLWLIVSSCGDSFFWRPRGSTLPLHLRFSNLVRGYTHSVRPLALPGVSLEIGSRYVWLSHRVRFELRPMHSALNLDHEDMWLRQRRKKIGLVLQLRSCHSLAAVLSLLVMVSASSLSVLTTQPRSPANAEEDP